MRELLCALILVACFCSCNNEDHRRLSGCSKLLDSIVQGIDSSQYEIYKSPQENLITLYDKKNSLGERGIFRFDTIGILKMYAFLNNDSNGYKYSINYDDEGNIIANTGRMIVQWYFRYDKKDSIGLTFLLCTLNDNYGDIKVKMGRYEKNNINLFKSDFIKLIGSTIYFPDKGMDENTRVIITGLAQNKCTGKIHYFSDSCNILF